MQSKLKFRPRLVLGAFLLAVSLAACEEQGPAEKLGESIDESVEETGEAMQNMADEVENSTN